MSVFDLCIVGGGPAGATYACLARRAGMSVALIDAPRRSRGVASRVETLSAEGARLLGDAGLADCLGVCSAIPSTGTCDAWSTPNAPRRRAAILEPLGSGFHVERAAFDAALRETAARSGASLHAARIRRAVATANGFELGAPGLDLSCRTLVDATGSAAAIARRLGVRRRVVDRQIVVSTELLGSMDEPELRVGSCADGWVYLTPRSDDRTYAAFVTDAESLCGRDPREALRGAVCSVLGPSFERFLRAEVDAAVPPTHVSPMLTQVVDGTLPVRFWVLGDAAWTPDPLSGHGVARALESALHLARGAAAAENGPALLALRHLRRREEHYRASPWIDKPYYRNRMHARARAEELLDD